MEIDFFRRNRWNEEFHIFLFYDYRERENIFEKIKISTGGACLLGEGSHGSEGFIAYITSDEKLNWVIYFEESNPFINAVELPDTFLKVESSANYTIILDLKDPINIVSINEIEV